MSIQAISWALKQPIEHSPAKFVLVALANYAGADSKVWPSVSALVLDTCQNRKTIIANIQRLVDMGYLVDTGDRVGQTKSITVYQLSEAGSGSKTGTTKQSQNLPKAVPKLEPVSSPDIGTPNADEAVPNLRGSSPKNYLKQSQKLPEAVPKSSTEPLEPSKEPSGNRHIRAQDIELPDWLPAHAWQDWFDHRKAVKAPMTKRAAELCIKKLNHLRQAGNDPIAVIEQSVITGKWTDLYAIRPSTAATPQRSSRPSQAELDAINAEAYALTFGRAKGDIIDV